MASLDLSMAFDMVNTELLIKRLKIMGMPVDLIALIKEWLGGITTLKWIMHCRIAGLYFKIIL